MPIELIKKTGRVDLTAYLPKSSLPTGIDMGEFVISSANAIGDFPVSHKLGVIPNYIYIYKDTEDRVVNLIRTSLTINIGQEFDEEEGIIVPSYNFSRAFYDTNTSVAQAGASSSIYDTDKVFYVPSAGSSRIYHPGVVYKWIAIAYGGNE